jgi:hyperosmotically inducible protein
LEASKTAGGRQQIPDRRRDALVSPAQRRIFSMRSLALACALTTILSGVPVLAGNYDADNSGKNARDRGDQTLTPTDQGGSEADRQVTAKIRKAVVNDDVLSTNAHNVKIITKDGVVTLRGPVKSASEKATVAARAQKIAGVKRVHNQLEIEKK